MLRNCKTKHFVTVISSLLSINGQENHGMIPMGMTEHGTAPSRITESRWLAERLLLGAGVAPSAAKLGRAAVLAGVASRDQGRFPVFATGPMVILAHSQTIADQGEKKDRHCEVHLPRQTSSTPSSPWPLLKIHSGPLQPRPE